MTEQRRRKAQAMARVAALEEALRHIRLAQEHIWGASCE